MLLLNRITKGFDCYFYPYTWRSNINPNNHRIDIANHKRFSTSTRWIWKRIKQYPTNQAYNRCNFRHPYMCDPKYKNLGIYGIPKRGEAKTIEEWVSPSIPNQDLIVTYLQGKIDIPTAMYLAMRRAEIALK